MTGVHSSRQLDGRAALVTGGGGGLGAALCATLAAAGAAVMVADIRADRAQAVADDIRARGGTAAPLAIDLAQPSAAAHAVDATVSALGQMDILINNAGIDRTAPIDELGAADWDAILAVNLSAPFHLARAAFRAMRMFGGGHIVNVTSTAAKRAWANASAYHASKWGLLGLSHALHVEGRPLNIKVTAVIAGGMRTPFLFDRFPDLDPALLQEPMQVAETVRFILTQPAESVIAEVTVLPVRETSWP